MPAPIDFVFVFVLVVVASLVEQFWFWPQFRAGVASGDPEARGRGYQRGIIGQWAFVVAAAAIWIAHGRTLTDLRLSAPGGWRLVLGIVIVGAMVALVILQIRALMRVTDARRVVLRPKLGSVSFLMPHTVREYRWFLVLSITAGICEELLYRGYLTWFLAPWLGTPGAFVAVVVLFGIGHAYQGRKGAIRATLAGAVMAAIVLATGWLVPAMIVHALVDAGSGTVGFMLLRKSAVAEDDSSAQLLAG